MILRLRADLRQRRTDRGNGPRDCRRVHSSFFEHGASSTQSLLLVFDSVYLVLPCLLLLNIIHLDALERNSDRLVHITEVSADYGTNIYILNVVARERFLHFRWRHNFVQGCARYMLREGVHSDVLFFLIVRVQLHPVIPFWAAGRLQSYWRVWNSAAFCHPLVRHHFVNSEPLFWVLSQDLP